MSSKPSLELCYRLTADQWLTRHLGKPSWRVGHQQAEPGGNLADLGSDGAVFAYAKIAVSDLLIVRDLVAHGFYPVDVAVMYEGTPAAAAAGPGIRFAKSSDHDAVAGIARSTFRYSRFHLDPSIPAQVANAIKAEWAGNFFSGQRGDAMVVAELHGRVVGFLQLMWQPDDALLIDLVGVHPEYQGRGIARELMRFASARGVGDGRVPPMLRVGTQVANTKSVRLYESMGLRLTSAQYVLHFHRS